MITAREPLSGRLPPQPLGILPTQAFWRDRENEARGCMPWVALALVVWMPIIALDLAWWVSAPLFLLCLVVTRGLAERYVRFRSERAKQKVEKPPPG
jgi:hypothetical protein